MKFIAYAAAAFLSTVAIAHATTAADTVAYMIAAAEDGTRLGNGVWHKLGSGQFQKVADDPKQNGILQIQQETDPCVFQVTVTGAVSAFFRLDFSDARAAIVKPGSKPGETMITLQGVRACMEGECVPLNPIEGPSRFEKRRLAAFDYFRKTYCAGASF